METDDAPPSHKELLARWPKDEAGEPEAPAFLMNFPELDGIADMTAAMLEAYGIPVLKEHRWGGALDRLYFGCARSGADLYVPPSRLEEARALLEAPSEEWPEDLEDLP